MNRIHCQTFIIGLMLTGTVLAGGMIHTSTDLQLDGKTWTLGNQQNLPQQVLRQYTTDGEKAVGFGWTRMLTFNQINIGTATVADWARVSQTNMSRQSPAPWVQIESTTDEAWVQIVYAPDASHATYEANAWHAFKAEGCAGMLVTQLSRQIPADASAAAAQSDQARATTVSDLALLKGLDWQPGCK